jgi:outer membrane lipoprotein SlyB
MTFAVQSISWNGKSYPVDASIDHVDVQKVRNSSTGNDAKKVIGGAVAGAIIGQIIGHNTKGTVIGAATGAAAGTAVAMGTADYEGCVPAGGNIRIKLNSPATIQAE